MKISHQVYLIGSGDMGFGWTHPSDCNVYLIASEKDLLLIDTGTGLSIDQLKKNMAFHGFAIHHITKILLTHIHADHAGGAGKFSQLSGAPVYAHYAAKAVLEEGDEKKIDLDKARDAGFYPEDYTFEACQQVQELTEGDTFDLGALRLTVIETPGHSAYDLSYFLNTSDGKSYLLSGDTVFYDGKISMLNTHDFDLKKLHQSITKLSSYEDVDVLLPGHYQPALSKGYTHIQKAKQSFDQLRIPENIL